MWIRAMRWLLAAPFYSLAVILVLVMTSPDRQKMMVSGGFAETEVLGIPGLIVFMCGVGMLCYVPSGYEFSRRRWYLWAYITCAIGLTMFLASYIHFIFR